MKYDMALGHESTLFPGGLTLVVYVFTDHENPVLGSSGFNKSYSGRSGLLSTSSSDFDGRTASWPTYTSGCVR